MVLHVVEAHDESYIPPIEMLKPGTAKQAK